MKTTNLEIFFRRITHSSILIIVRGSGGDTQFQREQYIFENINHTNHHSPDIHTNPTAEIFDFGKLLFNTLFDDSARYVFLHAQSAAGFDGMVRIILNIPTDLWIISSIPWEFMYIPNFGPIVSSNVSIVRYIALSGYIPPLKSINSLKILLTASKANPPLKVERELQIIEHILQPYHKNTSVVVEPNLSPSILQNRLVQGFHVWHFVGHGGLNEQEQSTIILQDENGDDVSLDMTQITSLLAGSSIRLIVLNSCSETYLRSKILQSAALDLAIANVPAVVAMQAPLSEEVSRIFADGFYRSLMEGRPVDICVNDGRKKIFTNTEKTYTEWHLPVVYTRVLEGDIFDSERAKPAITPPIRNSEERNRWILLEKVRRYWINGILNKSRVDAYQLNIPVVTNQDLIKSSKHTTRDLIYHQQFSQAYSQIYDVFTQSESALLIVGQPGSGKTTKLLEIVEEMLNRAEYDPLIPVPVILNLSSWTNKHRNLDRWISEELNLRYDVPPSVASNWVSTDKIAPMLDGLDEVLPQHREDCVSTINKYRQQHGFTPIAVCSRTDEYNNIHKQLHLSGAVIIQSISPAQVATTLSQAGSPMSGLLQAYSTDANLQELIETPLLLNIASIAYKDKSLSDITTSTSNADITRSILQEYALKMLVRPSETYPRNTKDGLRSLIWLSKAMKHQGVTELFIERMHISWTAGLPERICHATTFGIICGAIVGSAFGLATGIITDHIIENMTSLDQYNRSILNYTYLGLFVGILFGVTGSITSLLTKSNYRLVFFENMKWSREKALRELDWLSGWAALILFPALLLNQILLVLMFLICAVPLLMTSLTVDELETKNIPNQAIWRTLRSSIIFAIIPLILIILSTAIELYSSLPVLNTSMPIIYYLGVISSTSFFLYFGGMTAIYHLSLRISLFLTGKMPWNHRRFLDQLAVQKLMQKVGGGYIFHHRLILEYFSSLTPEEFNKLSQLITIKSDTRHEVRSLTSSIKQKILRR